jgi:transposase
MGRKSGPAKGRRQQYTDEFRREAVQMMLDGHSAKSVAERLGLSSETLLYNWKARLLREAGPVASSLEERVQALQAELLRVERERDILKKALAIFGREA